MNVIKAILFTTNVIFLIVASCYLWTVCWCWGVGGIIGIIGFFIGYRLSDSMGIAPRDYWRNPKYAIFKKKLTYANSVAGGTIVIASLIVMGLAMLVGLNL